MREHVHARLIPAFAPMKGIQFAELMEYLTLILVKQNAIMKQKNAKGLVLVKLNVFAPMSMILYVE